MLCTSLASQPRVHAPRWLPAACLPRSLAKCSARLRQQPRNASSAIIVNAASGAAPVETDTAATPAAPEAPSSSSSSSSSQVPPPADNILYATKLTSTRSPPTLEGFKAHVEKHAGVQDVMLVEGYTPAGRFRHVGYVIFDTPENAAAAQQKLHKSRLNGSIINVKTHRREPNSAESQGATQVAPNNQTTPSQNPKPAKARRGNPYAQANYVRVNNMAWATMTEDLAEHFEGCEGVQDAFITYNTDGRPSGSGYVKFETEEAAAAAVQALQGSMLDERELKLRQMKPAQAETTPATGAAVSSEGGAANPALKGAVETETRIVVKQVPPSFTWREVMGMCSVFGEVKRVKMLDSAKNKASEAAALAEGSGGENSEGEQKQKLVPAAVVFMTSRKAAEKALAALNGLEVQGSKLRANIYRGRREKAQSAPAVAVADADVSSGSE